MEHLQLELGTERDARLAVEGQLAEAQAAEEEARRYINSLESRERLLQASPGSPCCLGGQSVAPVPQLCTILLLAHNPPAA